MKEALRLKPSAPSLGREVTRDITIHHRTTQAPTFCRQAKLLNPFLTNQQRARTGSCPRAPRRPGRPTS